MQVEEAHPAVAGHQIQHQGKELAPETILFLKVVGAVGFVTFFSLIGFHFLNGAHNWSFLAAAPLKVKIGIYVGIWVGISLMTVVITMPIVYSRAIAETRRQLHQAKGINEELRASAQSNEAALEEIQGRLRALEVRESPVEALEEEQPTEKEEEQGEPTTGVGSGWVPSWVSGSASAVSNVASAVYGHLPSLSDLYYQSWHLGSLTRDDQME